MTRSLDATTRLREANPRGYLGGMDVPATRPHRPTAPQRTGDIIDELAETDDIPRRRRPTREWSAPAEEQELK